MILSDVGIRSLPPPPSGQVCYWDEKLPSFGLRVSQGGSKTFILNRHNTLVTIGRFPIVGLADARSEARKLLAEFTLGKLRPRSITFVQATELFLIEKGERRRQRTVADHKRHLNKLGFKCQLAAITHDDLSRKLKGLPQSEFNHRLSCAKTFFNWAHKKRYLSDNPTVGITPYSRPSRSRVLTDAELRSIWRETEEPTHFNSITRLCILTGLRRGECAALRKDYFSHNQQTVSLPGEVTKNHRPHTFPVGPYASELLRQLCASAENGYLFPARGKSDKPFNGWSKAMTTLREQLGDDVGHFTLHDLRRTFRTNLGRLKVRPDIAERLVNHISARTDMEEVYDLHTYLPEMREAIARWEAHLIVLFRSFRTRGWG